MKKAILLFLTVLGSFAFAMGQSDDCFPGKKDGVLVYDMANMLDDAQESQLQSQLTGVLRNSGNVIVVVIHKDFCGDAPFAYATEVGESMGVGMGEFDNGLVIAIGKDVRKAFIATGKGLEGAIPDAYAKRIVEEDIIPNFKEEEYLQGLSQAVSKLEGLATGEYKMPQQPFRKKNPRGVIISLIVLFMIFGIPFIRHLSRVRRYSQINEITFWSVFWLLAQSGQTHGGGWDDWTRGGGGFGGGFGGGGGGFGGFGGGSFGGGGAGGSW